MQLHDPLIEKMRITVSIKRDDLLHPIIHGNKWRKLKYNLVDFNESGKTEILTFGGPFSNHLYATAAAGKIFNIATRAIVRGPEIDTLNPTLRFAKACAMRLHPVSRITYRRRHESDYLQQLRATYPCAYILPEGGTNEAAIKGVQELANSLPEHDYLLCPTGSGGTLAGLLSGHTKQQVLGIAVLKGAQYLNQEVAALASKSMCDWQLMTDFHDGGYGRFSDDLLAFCQWMMRSHRLPLEPIYSGKMMYALWRLIERGYFEPGSHIIAVHTGGLQGKDGLRYRQLLKAN